MIEPSTLNQQKEFEKMMAEINKLNKENDELVAQANKRKKEDNNIKMALKNEIDKLKSQNLNLIKEVNNLNEQLSQYIKADIKISDEEFNKMSDKEKYEYAMSTGNDVSDDFEAYYKAMEEECYYVD